MPNLGQGAGWTTSEWRRAPRRRVPLRRLIAANRGRYLDERRVARYVRSRPGGDIWVVEHRGRLYVADGHHRAAAAIDRGDSTIGARVMTVGGSS
jgi:hypothetical protein